MDIKNLLSSLNSSNSKRIFPTDLPESLKSNYIGIFDLLNEKNPLDISVGGSGDFAYLTKSKSSPLGFLAKHLSNSSPSFSKLKSNDIIDKILGGNTYE